jgi:UDP-N-acetylmuramoyl-tripeptide--D-alanyl-D-alanine ligase
MEKLNLRMVAKYSNGEVEKEAGRTEVGGVGTDTRTIRGGDLFVALKGERFNGHDYLDDAARRGAAAVMVERGEMRTRRSPLPAVVVDSALTGLQQMAREYRATLPVRTVAVAGSNGKTITKELIAAVLGRKFATARSEGNLNNHIGVPISLLRLDASHQAGVFEVGTNHPGELRVLLDMVQPQAGVITTIGEEHLEFFHDLEGVAEEEGALAEALPAEGFLALNADDPWTPVIARRSRAAAVLFGFSGSAAFRATDVRVADDCTRFILHTPQGETEVRLSLIGRHQVSNALAAAAVGEGFGLTLEEIRKGLESVTPGRMRMERHITRSGVLILNDAYNANPNSMRAAFEAMMDMPVKGRRIAVLGGMRELGDSSAEAHEKVGAEVANSGVDVVIVVGEEALRIAEGARKASRPPSRIEVFSAPKEASDFLRNNMRPGDVVLVKASRGVALERVLNGLD